jgi:hypothetical protein
MKNKPFTKQERDQANEIIAYTNTHLVTVAQRFTAKAAQLMPEQSDLQDVPSYIDSASRIDEIMFAKSEYIGGMAVVILKLIA